MATTKSKLAHCRFCGKYNASVDIGNVREVITAYRCSCCGKVNRNPQSAGFHLSTEEIIRKLSTGS